MAFSQPKMEEIFPLLGMGQTAENLAEEFNISREDQDQYALASHQKALKNKNKIQKGLIPIDVSLRKKATPSTLMNA